MEIEHRFGLGDSVFVSLGSYSLDSLVRDGRDCIARSIIRCFPFYVCGTDRDCDGTPLYDVSLVHLAGNMAHLENLVINKTEMQGIDERIALLRLTKMITLRALPELALSKATISKD